MTKLCLALEAFRRTDEGRIRDAKAFCAHFFPQTNEGAKDRIFLHMPHEVRADLLSNWGIRGKKSALRDDDERVRNTVHDALNAGDIDASVIEEGITPEILTDWIPLEDWWVFWRGTHLPVGSVRKALATARELSLFDERWFFEHLELKSPPLRGIDVVCAALSKEQLVAWMHAIHTSGDASPSGIVGALGWETILAKTPHEALLQALDALARQIGLAEAAPEERKAEAKREPSEPPPTPRVEDAMVIETSAVVEAPTPMPLSVLPKPSVPPPRPSAPPIPSQRPGELPRSTKPPPPVPVSTKTPETAASKPPPVPMNKAPLPPASSKAPPVPSKQPPPVPSKKTPPVPSKPTGTKPPPSAAPPMEELPSVIIADDAPFFPIAPASTSPGSPASTVPNARALFLGAVEPPPMRPPQATLTGVAPQGLYGSIDDVAMPTFTMPPSDPEWAPPKAEPGDMGWDLVHGVTRPMGTNVQPKYNFREEDDEPTSEINVPANLRRVRSDEG